MIMTMTIIIIIGCGFVIIENSWKEPSPKTDNNKTTYNFERILINNHTFQEKEKQNKTIQIIYILKRYYKHG